MENILEHFNRTKKSIEKNDGIRKKKGSRIDKSSWRETPNGICISLDPNDRVLGQVAGGFDDVAGLHILCRQNPPLPMHSSDERDVASSKFFELISYVNRRAKDSTIYKRKC